MNTLQIKPHNIFMRLSCTVCLLNLIFLGLLGGVYAFSGFDLLTFLCFGNLTAVRCVLAICGVSSLFSLYALLMFKPFKGLK